MIRFQFLAVLFITTVVVTVLAIHQSPTRYSDDRIEWVSCWFENPSLTVFSWCARFYPGESMGGKPVSLPLVLLSRNPLRRDPEPVVYLQGGPGFATGIGAAGMKDWMQSFRYLDWEGDLLLYDQRGVGLSMPAAQCPDLADRMSEILSEPLSMQEDARRYRKVLANCIDALKDRGVDSAGLSTRTNVRDLEGMVDALGHEQVRLYGVSYGTRLAMQATRQMPERISAMVLDSAYPPDRDGLEWAAWNSANALEQFARACERQRRCANMLPEPERNVERLFHHLQHEPMPIHLDGHGEDSGEPFWLTGSRLFEAVYGEMYWNYPILPDALRWPISSTDPQGQFRELATNYREWLLDEDFSHVAFLAVECSDAVPAGQRRLIASGVGWIDEHMENFAAFRPCELLDQQPEPDAWREPVHSDIPTLFLAGELDPVTPEKWTREAAENFSNGHLEVFRELAHGVTYDWCPVAVAREFLRNPNLAPSHECLLDSRPSAFEPW